ncbi:ABC transporter substrate-binding protein [Chitinispirillales bacterium ANBcel5]|uniref:ABC transporter substrate-binding protein n=1 Tax=Cellulosispirillum alkaliphilum TaxID=3039283 RepID=UPI002A56ADFF|nr:ABC transporter substrate-binding protein [Chitinispirillales bacterium ANBcel5]
MKSVAIICGAILTVMSGCAPQQDSDGMFEAQQIDFLSLQNKAEAFVPEIGTDGGEIVLSTFSDPKSFNPITSTETSTSEFTALMFEGLVSLNAVTLQPEPALAERWEVSEDGRTYTFYMRPGIQWSDGTPISAYDVEFTFNELVFNNDINPNSARDIFIIEGERIEVEALDSVRVECRLPFVFAPFLRTMSQEILPKHKLAQTVEANEFSTALGIQTSASDIVVSGRFKLESYTSGQRVIFRRNPHYWKTDSEGNQLPYLDRVVYQIVSDQNVQLVRFKRGEIDYLTARGEDYPGLKRNEEDGNYTVYRLGPARGSNFLVFNQNLDTDSQGNTYVDESKLQWFRNPNFRRAVSYALDRESMIRIVMNGLGYPQWSPMTPSEGFFFNPDVDKYPFNREKALQILESEGFSDQNGDGILQDKDGNPVEFTFVTNSGNTDRIRIAEIIRRDLQDLGMRVHFQQVEFNSLIQRTNNPPYNWDAILLGLTGGDEPHFGRNVWHSSGTLHMWYPRQSKPSTDWEARIDSIYNEAVQILDPDERKVLYDEWQRIAARKQPFIYTVLPERILCLQNRFGNINPSTNGGILHNLEYIYVK